MADLYRLVYTSRNLLQGAEHDRAAVVAEILATSQRNNARAGVTGVLLFNAGSFAQVLEGPRPAVETTFERIQRDPRHSDVSVLQCEPVDGRGFPNWSMAFVGHSARGRALWSGMAGRTGFDLARIGADQLFATLHAIVLEEEDAAGDGAAPEVAVQFPRPEIVRPRGGTLDVSRLRAELTDRAHQERAAERDGTGPSEPSPSRGDDAAGIEIAVLRAALAEERGRTTELRRNLDEARIAAAVSADQVESLRRHRDVWAERAKALASALCRDPADSDRFAEGTADAGVHARVQSAA